MKTIIALIVFWVVSALYFAPQFSGQTLAQTDVQMYDGMKRDISEHRAAEKEDPQWTGAMFGGMPAYMITVQYPAMIIRNGAQKVLDFFGEPMALMFLSMFGFWLGLLMFRVNGFVAIFAALAYGLSTYNILIIDVGHITKMRALVYAPMLVGSVALAFRQGRMWVGGALSALFATLLIGAAHHQVTYYFGLVVVALWLSKITRKRRFWETTLTLFGAAVMAVGANFTHLYYTFEHSPDTIRAASTTGGVDLEYATAWSYGVGETVNLFIPNARGGSSTGGFSADGAAASALRQSGIDPRAAEQLPGYWGEQPFTAGPTYLGAVAVFLAIFALFVLPGRSKWWVVGVSAVALLMAWGHNAMWFTKLGFAVLPGLDKFRTVSMALVVLQWSVPFLAALGIDRMWKQELTHEKVVWALKWSFSIAAGAALIFAVFGGVFFDFSAASDGQFAQVPGLVDAMRAERAAMLRADAWRSFIFVALTAGVLYGARQRLTIVVMMMALVLADMVPVDRRFVRWSDFSPRVERTVEPDAADLEILRDKEPGYRVFNTANPFNEAYTSYFHRSVGGYHGAKLRRYQDVIDRYLSSFDAGVLNLLNAKYFILTDPETGARTVELNPDANGAAWFVEQAVRADDELKALGEIDNKTQAITDRDKRYEQGTIKLTEYKPNYLKYESENAGEGLAVFSEIYYDRGWTATIDGQPAKYFRADYILRAMEVPAGRHTIEWRFRAPRFATVEGVTLAASIAILIWLIIATLWMRIDRRVK